MFDYKSEFMLFQILYILMNNDAILINNDAYSKF